MRRFRGCQLESKVVMSQTIQLVIMSQWVNESDMKK